MAWTFTTLKSAIQDYTNNTESSFVSNLDEFIVVTEDRIQKLVELPIFRKNVTAVVTSGNQYLTMPADFLAPYSLAVDDSGYEYRDFKDVTFIRSSYPVASATGVPKYYAIYDENSFIMAPTPSSGFTVELHYQYKPPSISTTGDGTSWLGTNAADCILYGCLVEAYTYMKGEPDIIMNYDKRFMQAIDRLKVLGEGRNTKDENKTGTTRKVVN